ncbi:hypothetical protein [Anaeromassilibacillus sp. An172]|uniref:hypothetical protein n=1 Tax=Anaeromassilibacillus sp. An172 TaxID=1965570 RepID=UPI001302AE8A|nr:hypothetical protein [Anaeromassilibacillus sp. An172]
MGLIVFISDQQMLDIKLTPIKRRANFLYPTCKRLHCNLTPAQVGRVFYFRLAKLYFKNKHYFKAGETFSAIFGTVCSRLGFVLNIIILQLRLFYRGCFYYSFIELSLTMEKIKKK